MMNTVASTLKDTDSSSVEASASDSSWCSPPLTAEGVNLFGSRQITFTALPSSDAAKALSASLADHISQAEKRGKVRSRVEAAAFQQAVAAFSAELLLAWGRQPPAAVSRSLQAKSFTGEVVTRRNFEAVVKGLLILGLVMQHDGGRTAILPGVFRGLVTRWWPTAALLHMAAEHGITPATVTSDFTPPQVAKAPVIREPLVLRPLLKTHHNGATARKPVKATLPIPPDDAEAAALARDVRAHNALASKVEVTGCQPPRWHRIFLQSWQWGGRWYAGGGHDDSYQNLEGRDEKRVEVIRIAGEAVAEVDIRSSHLRLVYALLGADMPPDGDLYAVPGLPREVVKVWTTQALGKGKVPAKQWAAGTPEAITRVYRVQEVSALMTAARPVLHRLDEVGRLAVQSTVPPATMVPHVLQGVEARILTHAMATLREQPAPILSLPMHDGLIVPVSGLEATVGAFATAWEAVAGAAPLVLTVAQHGQDRAVRCLG